MVLHELGANPTKKLKFKIDDLVEVTNGVYEGLITVIVAVNPNDTHPYKLLNSGSYREGQLKLLDDNLIGKLLKNFEI